MSGVDAHGYVINPRTKYTGQSPDSPSGEHNAFQVLPPPSGVSYSSNDGAANAVAFKTALQSSKYKTLKDFVLAIERPEDVPKCAGSEPQSLPAKIEFGYPPYNTGFVHRGPCEMWCDDTRVMADDECSKTYGFFGKGLAKMTYDKDKCVGAKMFTYYWLNVDGTRWQTYINCAAIGRVDDSTPSDGNSNNSTSNNNNNYRPSDNKTNKPSDNNKRNDDDNDNDNDNDNDDNSNNNPPATNAPRRTVRPNRNYKPATAAPRRTQRPRNNNYNPPSVTPRRPSRDRHQRSWGWRE
ncbi:hypothetical protein PINS_up006097 [Pythium insidiosum]|nr:hypothetical protein PINS_up006091 [Pythium insidiosum]GLD97409.1 hypothetical protein PINS_up006093 [Pythium insidiosum]GLD97411.1 hypothetical protein PINS_up006095 [Pythium insidiosum]GLD97413.1 hypothetical protein PINS_up006097 [Pythium insidiosum]